MPEYDFYLTVRSDLDQLQKELNVDGIDEQIDQVAQQLGLSRDVTLAVLWRSSKRHGETLSVFVGELINQSRREAARQETPEEAAPAQPSGPGSTAPRL